MKLLKNANGDGIKINTSQKSITIDLGGFTYTVDGKLVGSSGTATNGFQLLTGGSLTIKNGTITSTKAMILIQNYCNLTLENMVLDGTGMTNYYAYTLSNNNGNVQIKDSTITAASGKVAFDVCRYSNYDGPSVTVSGNSVINGKVEISSSGAKENATHKLIVTGGTFNGEIVKSGSSPDFVGNITGGTFTGDVSDYVVAGMKQDGTAIVIDTATAVAEVNGVGYNTLAAAIAAVPTDGTETKITLLKNAQVDAKTAINGGRNVVIDMNGHNISATDRTLVVSNAKLNVIGTGIIEETNVDQLGAIVVFGSTDSNATNYTVVTIGENVTLKGWSGIIVNRTEAETNSWDSAGVGNTQNHAYGVVINVNGKLIAPNADKGIGLYVNGSIKDTEGNVPIINLNGATLTSADGAGIYAAGYAKWNIEDTTINAENAAIEIRAGEMTINGGTYEATAVPTSVDPNGNGTTTSGAAIAVAQHTTKLPIDLTILSGEFKGYTALNQNNPENQANNDIVKVTVSGGVFTATQGGTNAVNSVNNTLSVTGGTFSSDPTAYVAGGYIAKKNSETEYAVIAKSGLTSGVYMSNPTGATAANHYVTKNNDGTWTVFYVAPYVAPTYSITVDSAKHGDVTVSPRNASKGATVTITVESDKGYTLETLTVTDKNGDEIELTNKGDGKYTFTMPAGKVYVEATFMEDNSMLNFFVDVFPGDYYYDAVLWAAKNGITGGVDAAHFAPNATCTRAQVVTFLWRAAGSPAPKSSMMPFTDVPAGSYYETAVLWAAENGITGGTGNNAFSPDAACSRGQIVSFLWRALGSPTASGSANPFADVAADAYYNTAVLWAAENGITGGTGNNAFSPDADCTRAQIVTFLYRSAT